MAAPRTEQPAKEGAGVNLEGNAELLPHLTTRLEEARHHADAGEVQSAWDVCDSLLKNPDLPVHIAAKVALIVHDIGKTELAETLQAAIYDKLMECLDRLEDPERALLPAAEAFADLGHFDQAERLCRKASDSAPDSLSVAVGYTAFLVYRDRKEEALKIAQTYCRRDDNQFNGSIHFAMIFNHLKVDDAAKACLETAKSHCKTKTQRAKLDFFLASNGMTTSELDQHGMAVELFDGFAQNYDTQLTKLENNGPRLVFSALEELQLPKTKTRRILDAGCGTGLCAGFLRDYAKELFGVDLSVKMLEISRKKGGYDFLARTDLSVPATYPEGRFDMIVCADVLVYFGAVDTVFQNFSNILSPGGWLLLTVEDESDPDAKAGFRLYRTGRYKHSVDYLTRTLAQAGFPKPKLIRHARLRNELARPILGTVMAVQKPALLF